MLLLRSASFMMSWTSAKEWQAAPACWFLGSGENNGISPGGCFIGMSRYPQQMTLDESRHNCRPSHPSHKFPLPITVFGP